MTLVVVKWYFHSRSKQWISLAERRYKPQQNSLGYENNGIVKLHAFK